MDYLFHKLSCFTDLSGADRKAIRALDCTVNSELPGRDLISEGDRPESMQLILEGWAYRYTILKNGSRQILGLLLPGDICDMHVFILKHMDHSIGALSPVKFANVSPSQMLNIIDNHTAINHALWWATLVDEATQRAWLANLGQRDAYNRVAHLFCELRLRLDQVGLLKDEKIDFPMTQKDIADMVGMTPVHVNRVLQSLRKDGLINLQGKQLKFLDFDRMAKNCDFDANYLHLDRRKARGE